MIDRRHGAAGIWTPKRAALALIGLGIAGLVLLEIWFRVTTPEPRWVNQRYLEISRDFEELEALIADWGSPTRYYDEFLYGAGNLQKNLVRKLEALVEGRVHFPLGEPNPGDENLAAMIRVYTSNVRMLRATCDVFEVRCFFLHQPLLLAKTPLSGPKQSAFESLKDHPRFGPDGVRFVREFYRQAAVGLADEAGFLNVSGTLAGRQAADFYDVGHVGALMPPVIGERTAALMLARLH